MAFVYGEDGNNANLKENIITGRNKEIKLKESADNLNQKGNIVTGRNKEIKPKESADASTNADIRKLRKNNSYIYNAQRNPSSQMRQETYR